MCKMSISALTHTHLSVGASYWVLQHWLYDTMLYTLCLRKMFHFCYAVTDFPNSFTGTLCAKFAIMQLLDIPPHLNTYVKTYFLKQFSINLHISSIIFSLRYISGGCKQKWTMFNSALVGPQARGPVLCTCCTIHSYATEHAIFL